MADAPKTLADLKQSIEELVRCRKGPARSVDEDGTPYLCLTSGGYKEEGGYPEYSQLFFSEKDACIAFWYHFSKVIGGLTWERGLKIDWLNWREEPYLSEANGTYRVTARFSLKIEERTNAVA